VSTRLPRQVDHGPGEEVAGPRDPVPPPAPLGSEGVTATLRGVGDLKGAWSTSPVTVLAAHPTGACSLATDTPRAGVLPTDPADVLPFLMRPVSSMISTPPDPSVPATWSRTSPATIRLPHGAQQHLETVKRAVTCPLCELPAVLARREC
jgi:hypothetical protein